MPYESPYELQERLKQEAANREIDRLAAAARAEKVEAAQSTYVPPKDRALMTPVEIEAERREQREREQREAAEVVEKTRKDRARRAYVATTGSEQGFDGLYESTIRKKMVEQETLAQLGGEEVAVGETTADGSVRW
jgi:hypothetical protein